MPDHRFEELTSHLTAFRELPVSALPRRAAVPRVSGNATFSSMPTAVREALSDANASAPLLRSRSATRDIGIQSNEKLPALAGSSSKNDVLWRMPAPSHSSTEVQKKLHSSSKTSTAPPVSPTHTADLDMTSPEVDSTFRLRYDVVYRDHAGTLIMKPFSEWDDFHSSKIWGVFGIVDCTQPGIRDSLERREQAIFEAYDDFNLTLTNFKDASVRRLVVFTPPDTAQESGSFVNNDPKSPSKENVALHFSVGYVPEMAKYEETRLEVRAQIIHFAGLLLHAIDRDSWKRRESPATDLFLSPIDEKYTADRQSKLSKRRAGRLDKLLGDSLLLMGSPSEALVKYNSAIEKAKANSDRLWLAGAMEGWSAAHVFNHVGSGRSVDDPILSDKLIEHYGEIYKLYQKKRVAEPEAAAALRLAEFLGRWTSRRKDALDAAEHAATVGEGLRIQKRAALWEALARFSDRMGCRRKAALYLYRLGLLNASQSVWSSAVALMTAAERQLSSKGRKPWAKLNRRVLLTAASHAEKAGDTSAAAKLYVEALVIDFSSPATGKDEDEDIVKVLSKSQVPAFVPAAQDVVCLKDVSPLQIGGLSIHEKEEDTGDRSLDTNPKDGPFIYNPFEARKRAKAAAVARRAVTWVCGESAQVSVQLHSRIGAEVIVDVISVLFSVVQPEEEGGTNASEALVQKHREGSHGDGDGENASARHTRLVREALHDSSQIAKTIQETLTLYSHRRKSGTIKNITVIPKRTGALQVRGLLLRIFSGALVLLEANATAKEHALPVNVISQLPRISLSSYSSGGGTMESISSRSPLTVYHGERRRFRVDIENTGKQAITWMRARINSSHPQTLKVLEHDFGGEKVWENLERQGMSKSFMVEVLGMPARERSSRHLLRASSSLSSVSVAVEYEGKDSSGIIRESGTHVKVSCKPGIRLGRIDIYQNANGTHGSRDDDIPVHGVALEVRNDVSAPATVQLAPGCGGQSNETAVSMETGPAHARDECLIESGASVRLTTTLSTQLLKELRQGHAAANDSESPSQAVYRILWKLPALGRQGFLFASRDDLSAALLKTQMLITGKSRIRSYLSCSRVLFLRAKLTVKLDGDSNADKDVHENDTFAQTVHAGRFQSVLVHIRNTSECDLPHASLLDIRLVQNDERGVVLEPSRAIVVGATEKVKVGALRALSGECSHTLKIRISSTGTFRLLACLYDASESYHVDADPEEVTMTRESFPQLADTHHEFPVRNQFAVGSGSGKKEDFHSAPATSELPLHTSLAASDSEVSPTGKKEQSENIRPCPQEPETPHTLKRVGMKKKKKNDISSKPVLNVLRPSTVDTYPYSPTKDVNAAVLACGELTFSVVPDKPAPSLPTDAKRAQSYPHLHGHDGIGRELTSTANAETLYH